MIPPLVTAFLEAIQLPAQPPPKKGFVLLSSAICCILNVFCKVRGEKVIQGFLNNEPRYLEPIISELEANFQDQSKDGEGTHHRTSQPWVERYVLLLWLSHLLLAPFPLDSMSANQPSDETSKALGIQLPPAAPGFTLRVLSMCIESLRSASKERSAAANLLVKLCIRPDMQKLGLLKVMVEWTLSFFSEDTGIVSNIHQALGILSFMSGLVSSATNEEIGSILCAIYQSCYRILHDNNLGFVRSSAVARKTIIKVLRNIVLHCLQPTAAPHGLDPTQVLEEVIEYLLEALADGDTPVRYGASKALSIITLKLDQSMAGDVVEAILGSLAEDIHWQSSKRNLNRVNPLRWHGLTLTLSHLLYRKAISESQLPDVLNALLLSLSFEQRSPMGGSVGTNVRDAACFGIWALSRRYPTADLLAIDVAAVNTFKDSKSPHVLQILATELVTAACLDPAGNIRRGSSAALQELIGRHPNTIEEGISLVQVVDFHAVGLRQRAMCEVAVAAGNLHVLYWEALFEKLLDWRGTGSLDADSRVYAGQTVGLMSKSRSSGAVQQMSHTLRARLATLKPREVEERHGLVSALAALINASNTSSDFGKLHIIRADFLTLWEIFQGELQLEDKAFMSPALRPEFTAASICKLVGALASVSVEQSQSEWPRKIHAADTIRIFNLCLGRHEVTVMDAVIEATPAILQLLERLPDANVAELLSQWFEKLENEASYSGRRCSGHAVALGAAFGTFVGGDPTNQWPDIRKRIVKILTFRCTAAVAIEARTVSLQALRTLLQSKNQTKSSSIIALAPDLEAQIGSALHIALNDYTITERGDVGSLVRLEALSVIRLAWTIGALDIGSEWGGKIYTDVLRLSLEKLDKLRVRAAHILRERSIGPYDNAIGTAPTDDVSTQHYFKTSLELLQVTQDPVVVKAVCKGFVIAAGMSSESVVQNARAAISNFVDTLPDGRLPDADHFSLLDLANEFVDMLRDNLENDRILLPLLEVLAFLFDVQVMQRLQVTPFK